MKIQRIRQALNGPQMVQRYLDDLLQKRLQKKLLFEGAPLIQSQLILVVVTSDSIF